MLSFVQQILAFVTFEVLEPNWHALEGKLQKVTTVDQLLRDHVDFLDTCLKESMLTSSKLLKVGRFFFSKFHFFADSACIGLFKVDRGLPDFCAIFCVVYKICQPGYCCC